MEGRNIRHTVVLDIAKGVRAQKLIITGSVLMSVSTVWNVTDRLEDNEAPEEGLPQAT